MEFLYPEKITLNLLLLCRSMLMRGDHKKKVKMSYESGTTESKVELDDEGERFI